MQDNTTLGSLQGRFEDFGALPSNALWGKIEDRIQEKRNRRGLFFWWTSGIAAVLLLSFGIYYFSNSAVENTTIENIVDESGQPVSPENSNPIVADNSELTNDSQEENSSDNSAEEALEDDTEEKVNNGPYNAVKWPATDPVVEENNLTDLEKSVEMDEYVVAETLRSLTTREKIELLPQSTLATLLILPLEIASDVPPTTIDRPVKQLKKWELGLDYAFFGPASKGTSTADLNTGPIATANDFGQETIPVGFASVQMNETYAPAQVTSATALRPLNASFSLRRHFGRRWSGSIAGVFSNQRYRTNYSPGSLELTKSSVLSAGFAAGIRMNLNPNGKKWKWFTGIGHQMDIPFHEKRIETYNVALAASEAKFGKKVFGLQNCATAEIGLRRNLSDRLSLQMSWNGRWYYYQRMNDTAPLSNRSIWLGGTAGIFWSI